MKKKNAARMCYDEKKKTTEQANVELRMLRTQQWGLVNTRKSI
jgi:hypothetical protein